LQPSSIKIFPKFQQSVAPKIDITVLPLKTLPVTAAWG